MWACRIKMDPRGGPNISIYHDRHLQMRCLVINTVCCVKLLPLSGITLLCTGAEAFLLQMRHGRHNKMATTEAASRTNAMTAASTDAVTDSVFTAAVEEPKEDKVAWRVKDEHSCNNL